MQLNWNHHRIIMSRCKTEAERLFYIQLTATERYTTRELERQINSGIFERTLLADVKLPLANQSQSQKLSGVFRDSYVLDFLNLTNELRMIRQDDIFLRNIFFD
jgi:predicted nuclease of restriction endonuclease-like (RecB) superfamily